MTAEKYVKMITKRIICNGQKKKEIQRQLLTEIEERTSAGEELESVIAQMGSINEISDSFNENISDTEKKRFKNRKVIKVLISVLMAFSLLLVLLYWIFPKTNPISSSSIFVEDEVKEALTDTIDLLDSGDYEELRNNATSDMSTILKKDKMENIKKKMCDSWGNRQMMGTIYTQEVIQMNVHYATCQVNVAYENISVVYTISFDKDMKIAGLYMK